MLITLRNVGKILSLTIKMKTDSCSVKTEYSACKEPYQALLRLCQKCSLITRNTTHWLHAASLLFGLNDQQVSLLTNSAPDIPSSPSASALRKTQMQAELSWTVYNTAHFLCWTLSFAWQEVTQNSLWFSALMSEINSDANFWWCFLKYLPNH